MINKLCIETVQKGWGFEAIISNNEKGCCKILYLEPNKMGSKHYHEKKNEVFIIVEGIVRLEYQGVDTEFLLQGDEFIIVPCHWHRFVAVDKPAKILELSDQHFDEDTFRHEVARNLTPDEIIEMELAFNEFLNKRED